MGRGLEARRVCARMRTLPSTHLQSCMLGTSSQAISGYRFSPRRTALQTIGACSDTEVMTCLQLATPWRRKDDSARTACSMKSFMETDPIPAAYSVISCSRAKASGLAQPYVSETQLCKTAGTGARAEAFVPLQWLFKIWLLSLASVDHAATTTTEAHVLCHVVSHLWQRQAFVAFSVFIVYILMEFLSGWTEAALSLIHQYTYMIYDIHQYDMHQFDKHQYYVHQYYLHLHEIHQCDILVHGSRWLKAVENFVTLSGLVHPTPCKSHACQNSHDACDPDAT